jgi:hypothetical protein
MREVILRREKKKKTLLSSVLLLCSHLRIHRNKKSLFIGKFGLFDVLWAFVRLFLRRLSRGLL